MGWFRVDSDALTADAHGLAAAQESIASPGLVAPADDPATLGVSTQLIAHSDALATVVEHSGALRTHGGAVLALGAAVLRSADEEHAAALAAVTHGTTLTQRAPLAPRSVPPAPPDVTLPDIPVAVAAPPLSGEQFATLIHCGAGTRGLFDFAEAWRAHAWRLEELADRVRSCGDAIDAHWTNGTQMAGVNTREHAGWLRTSADRAGQIARAANDLADGFEAAKRSTPSPEDFAAARQAFASAQGRGDPIGAAQAMKTYVTLEAQASDTAASYQNGARAIAARLGAPLGTAPAIARSGVQTLSAGICLSDYKTSPFVPPPEPPAPAPVRGLPPEGVHPPVPGNVTPGPASRPSEQRRGGQSLWDEKGGEWRYFPGDKWHNPHWDYNAHDLPRGSEWRNVPIDNLPPRIGDPAPVVEPPSASDPAEGGLPVEGEGGGIGAAPSPLGPTLVPLPHSIHHLPVLGQDDPSAPWEDEP